MKAEEFIKQGDVSSALSALKNSVRDDPANSQLRVFLFQLLLVDGNYDSALNQLNVVGEMDAETILMVQAYRGVVLCEKMRAEVFA